MASSSATDLPAPSSSASLSDAPPSSLATTIHIGSRKSVLALIQTEIVHKSLRSAWPDLQYEIHSMSTMGDKNQITPLHDFGAKSLWTHELEALLLEGKLHMIVHSLKDMPTQLPPTLTIGAILLREDPRDALIMKSSLATTHTSIASLPAGSIVGTSSVRRSAQIARKYPHLRFKDVRGNVGTRLAKLDAEDGEYACLILAAAGIKRLELGHRITQYLDSRNGGLLHAVGQGALGIEIRQGDERIKGLLKQLEHRPTALACLAERSLMRTLEGGCSVPIGVETEWEEGNGDGGERKEMLRMRAVVVSLDGTESVERERVGKVVTEGEADEFGWAMAREMVEKGAAKILEKINLNRDIINA
ncbi:MAG: porphobilinogen deaminase [Piccolia ochrophora]|nr:MAG: porphobilinogen deaminase [Piccolia ochrophora]